MNVTKGNWFSMARYLLVVFIAVLGLLTVIGTGGGGGDGGGGGSESDNTTPTDDQDNTTPTDDQDDTTPTDNQAPKISGFDFELKECDFWEFSWKYEHSYWGYSSSSGSESGVFCVKLGPPISIDGIQAHELLLFGNTIDEVKPRWKYIAMDDNKMFGSNDGQTLQVIFDAKNGEWPGNGFFASFTALVQAQECLINNDYFTDSNLICCQQSTSQSQCSYYGEYGTICGGDYNETDRSFEYYKSGVGPVYYNRHKSMSDMTSSDSWSATHDYYVWLVRSSFEGEIPACNDSGTYVFDPSSWVYWDKPEKEYYTMTVYSTSSAQCGDVWKPLAEENTVTVSFKDANNIDLVWAPAERSMSLTRDSGNIGDIVGTWVTPEGYAVHYKFIFNADGTYTMEEVYVVEGCLCSD